MTCNLCVCVSSFLKFSFVTKLWRIREGEWIPKKGGNFIWRWQSCLAKAQGMMWAHRNTLSCLPHELSHNSFALLPFIFHLASVFPRFLFSSLTSVQLIVPRASRQVHTCGKEPHSGFFSITASVMKTLNVDVITVLVWSDCRKLCLPMGTREE